MARVGYGLIPEELEPLFNKAIASGNRYIYVCYRRVLQFFSRYRELELLDRSYLVPISQLWFGLTEPQRQAWRDVSPFVGSNGWKLFVSDTAERMNLGLSGVATPNQYHQVRVGHIEIEAPATGIMIGQLHPETYYVKQKVPGTQSQFAPVLITEKLTLPLMIGLNYKSDLTQTEAGATAKMIARVKSLYQGRNIFTDLTLSLDLSSGWQYDEVELTSVLGYVVSYTILIEIVKATGELWFDNPKIYHTGQNWVRDKYCDDISEVFSMAFRQVLPNWQDVSVGSGASYDSIYVDS